MSHPAQDAADQMVNLLSQMGHEYVRLAKEGIPEQMIYEGFKDKFQTCWNVSELRAANLTRLVINFGALEHSGKPQYTEEELRDIFALAFPEQGTN